VKHRLSAALASLALLAVLAVSYGAATGNDDQRLTDLERQLDATQARLALLQTDQPAPPNSAETFALSLQSSDSTPSAARQQATAQGGVIQTARLEIIDQNGNVVGIWTADGFELIDEDGVKRIGIEIREGISVISLWDADAKPRVALDTITGSGSSLILVDANGDAKTIINAIDAAAAVKFADAFNVEVVSLEYDDGTALELSDIAGGNFIVLDQPVDEQGNLIINGMAIVAATVD